MVDELARMREAIRTKYPDYQVALEPSSVRVCVTFNGERVADSSRALCVRETAHKPVYYFPREDVRMNLLERTQHHTTCPFKGQASYWTLRVGDREAENAVWTYEDPIDEVPRLKDYVAFYGDRVEITTSGSA